MRKKQNKGFSLFRSKIDYQSYAHDAEMNRDLDRFSIKLIKVVGVFGILAGIVILVAFWYWVFTKIY
jgi:hypothetical protein